MTERKWTPGPWRIYESGAGVRPGIEARSVSIVAFGCEDDNEGVFGETTDMANANAHLIAAAPDLYEALEEIHHGLMSGVWDGRLLQSKAEAALAKARGEA